MPRFRLTIEYEGTRYHGWQIQENARTIQGEILRACRVVVPSGEIELHGAGRTDAGVHALGQVAHLDATTDLPPEALHRQLNDALPPDICIVEIVPVSPRFHARLHACSRTYLYQIARRRTAFGKRFVWWVKDPLDLDRMRKAATLFVGMRDFASFADKRREGGSSKVLVEAVTIAEAEDLVLVRVKGSHFLWRMVRRMVGVLVEVGRGRLALSDVKRFLATTATDPARLTAPPSGLFLERVDFADDTDEEPATPVIRVSAAGQGRAAERPKLQGGRWRAK